MKKLVARVLVVIGVMVVPLLAGTTAPAGADPSDDPPYPPDLPNTCIPETVCPSICLRTGVETRLGGKGCINLE